MICVLKVVQGPAAGRKCWLKRDQRVTIGRLATADFSITSDAHMSRNHLIIEGLSHSFRLRDIGSANGTFVNDMLVSVVELCSGDRIKAGSSVFEVNLELGEETPPTPVLTDEQVLSSVPQRTLSSQDLGSVINEITVRYTASDLGLSISDLDSDMPIDHDASEQADAFSPLTVLHSQQVSQPVPTSPVQPASIPSTRGQSASQTSTVPTVVFDEFKSEPGSLLRKQRSRGDRNVPARVLDSLLQLAPTAFYSLVVNRTQLEGVERSALDFLLSTRESRYLTETLCVIESRKPENIIEFYKRCLNKDAAILIVSEEQLSDQWLAGVIDTLSYPSLFGDVLGHSNDRVDDIAAEVHFILFEANSSGELGLLCRNG